MRVSLEWFLLDNFAANWLLLKLAGALSGVALRPFRAVGIALLGAVWNAMTLGRFSKLLSPLGRIACLLLTARFMGRRAYLRSLLSLFLSSLLLGGGLLLFTLGRAGPWTGGAMLGTVPLRAAVYGLCLLPPLVRAVRQLVQRGYEGSCRRPILLTVGGKEYALVAFIDSGNLLTEPLSGLPVVLVEGIELPAGRPLSLAGHGVTEVVYATVKLDSAGPTVPVYVGLSPLPLIDFQALLPAAALYEGRKNHVQKAKSPVLSALCPLLHPALPGVSRAYGGEPAATAAARGGAKLRPGRQGQRGGPKQAHRAQPPAGGVHLPEV